MGKSPEYIKKRLLWLGETFRTYLRDTIALNDASVEVEQVLAQPTLMTL
jgi:hypothetical protein